MNTWTKQEDQLLLLFYSQTQTFKKWKQISDRFFHMGIQKSVYQCRERYINKLDPVIKKEKWSKQQIKTLFTYYHKHGSKWQKMQNVLPQRTQGQLKNKFYSFLRSFILKTVQHSKHLKNFKVNAIPSKSIKRLFEGGQEFGQYSGKINEYLSIIQYQITSENIQQLLTQRDFQLKQILKILFQSSKKNKNKQISDSYSQLITNKKNHHKSRILQKQKEIYSQEKSNNDYHMHQQQKKQLNSFKFNFQHEQQYPNQLKIQYHQEEKEHQSYPLINLWSEKHQQNLKKQECFQPDILNSNSWLEWGNNPFQYQYSGLDNFKNTQSYQQYNPQNIISRPSTQQYYTIPYQGTQNYFYPF